MKTQFLNQRAARRARSGWALGLGLLLAGGFGAGAESGPAATNAAAATAGATNAEAGVVSVADSRKRMEALDNKHRLAIGDRLSFRILEDQEEPKPLVVTDSGDLEVPYLGRIPAENKTCKQMAQELKVALEREYYFQATVLLDIDLLAKTRGRVYLVGPVRLPGPQEIPSDEVLTLSKVILRAGGFMDTADKQHVKVTRKAGATEAEQKTFLLDVQEIFDKGQTDKDLPLEAGDLILIPDLTTRVLGKVYLVGSVRTAGPQDIPIDETLTLSKAILRAGGFTDYADRRHVTVTRKPAEAKAENKVFTVDVESIYEKGKFDLDVTLQPGDYVRIPERLLRF